MAEWFYAQNGQQYGPISEEELQALADAGHLQPDDLIWKNGMPNWVAARETDGLFPDRRPAMQYAPHGAYAEDLRPARRAGYADRWEQERRPRATPVKSGNKGVLFGVVGGVVALALVGGAIAFLLNGGDSSNRRSFSLRTGRSTKYNVEFKKGKVVEITAKADEGKHLDIHVFDNRGRKIAGTESPTNKCRVVFVPDRTQTYRVQVINPRIQHRPEFNRTMSGELTWKILDSAKLGERDKSNTPLIARESRFALHTSEASTHYVRFEAGKTVEVTVRSTGQSDVDLFIFDNSGRRIAADEAFESHCRLVITPKTTQTYKLQVVNRKLVPDDMGRNGFNTGTLKWEQLGAGQQLAGGNDNPPPNGNNPPPNGNDPPQLIPNPQGVLSPPFTVRNLLPKNAPRLGGRHPYILYHVSLQAGRQYIIEMNGTFDTYLFLKNAAGMTLSRDDDGGPGLNSKMTYRPTVGGVYRLYASAFSARHSGAFTLSVREIGNNGFPR